MNSLSQMLSSNLSGVSQQLSHRASFTSYIENEEMEMADRKETQQTLEVINARLLEEETTVAWAKNVHLFSQFTEDRRALVGILCVSDFRVIFVDASAADGEENVNEPLINRSTKFRGRYDIALCNIDSIQYKSSKSETFKSLSSSVGRNDKLSQIKIRCKDFRELSFGFSVCESARAKEVVNALLHYAFPEKLERLFAFTVAEHSSRKFNKDPPNPDITWNKFNRSEDWTAELSRVDPNNRHAAHLFRITDKNRLYYITPTYPSYVVVPRCLKDVTIEHSSGNFYNRRFPIWCWSNSSGCSLFKSAGLSTNSEVTAKHWEGFVSAIIAVHPDKAQPTIIETTISPVDIQQSFLALQKICTPSSVEDFWECDNTWYKSLDSTGWMGHVSQCLRWTHEVVMEMVNNHSVIVRELHGRDIACVVSSLAQMCMDPYFRTVAGFMSLIQKEWVVAGHPFGLRLYGLEFGKTGIQKEEVAPVFLLFLDCVYQLLSTHPLDFEFTSHYLVATWDAALTGLCRRLLFNSMRDHNTAPPSPAVTSSSASSPGGPSSIPPAIPPPRTLPDEFNIIVPGLHFTPTYRPLFMNPFYAFAAGGLSDAASSLTRRRPSLQDTHSSPVAGRLPRQTQDIQPSTSSPSGSRHQSPRSGLKRPIFNRPKLLRPPGGRTVADIVFWTDAYTRWQPTAQWHCGGPYQRQVSLLSALHGIARVCTGDKQYITDGQRHLEKTNSDSPRRTPPPLSILYNSGARARKDSAQMSVTDDTDVILAAVDAQSVPLLSSGLPYIPDVIVGGPPPPKSLLGTMAAASGLDTSTSLSGSTGALHSQHATAVDSSVALVKRTESPRDRSTTEPPGSRVFADFQRQQECYKQEYLKQESKAKEKIQQMYGDKAKPPAANTASDKEPAVKVTYDPENRTHLRVSSDTEDRAFVPTTFSNSSTSPYSRRRNVPQSENGTQPPLSTKQVTKPATAKTPAITSLCASDLLHQNSPRNYIVSSSKCEGSVRKDSNSNITDCVSEREQENVAVPRTLQTGSQVRIVRPPPPVPVAVPSGEADDKPQKVLTTVRPAPPPPAKRPEGSCV